MIPTQAFPCEFCKIFKNTYFVKHHLTAALERIWCNKLLPYPSNKYIKNGRAFLKKDILLKHVLFSFWKVIFSLAITFCMEYCKENFCPDLIWVRQLLLRLKVIISTTSFFYSLEKYRMLKLSRWIKIIKIP